MRIEKRFVTRQFVTYGGWTWNIWDKKECKWLTTLGFAGREDALKQADEMNKKERENRR